MAATVTKLDGPIEEDQVASVSVDSENVPENIVPEGLLEAGDSVFLTLSGQERSDQADKPSPQISPPENAQERWLREDGGNHDLQSPIAAQPDPFAPDPLPQDDLAFTPEAHFLPAKTEGSQTFASEQADLIIFEEQPVPDEGLKQLFPEVERQELPEYGGDYGSNDGGFELDISLSDALAHERVMTLMPGPESMGQGEEPLHEPDPVDAILADVHAGTQARLTDQNSTPLPSEQDAFAIANHLVDHILLQFEQTFAQIATPEVKISTTPAIDKTIDHILTLVAFHPQTQLTSPAPTVAESAPTSDHASQLVGQILTETLHPTTSISHTASTPKSVAPATDNPSPAVAESSTAIPTPADLTPVSRQAVDLVNPVDASSLTPQATNTSINPEVTNQLEQQLNRSTQLIRQSQSQPPVTATSGSSTPLDAEANLPAQSVPTNHPSAAAHPDTSPPKVSTHTSQPVPPPTPSPDVLTQGTELSAEDLASLDLLPIGIVAGAQQNLDQLIHAKEDGTQVEQWLLPMDTVLEVLKFDVATQADGTLALSGPGGTLQINPRNLKVSPDIGPVFSVADLKRHLGVETTFNLAEYQVVLNADWLNERELIKRPLDTAEPLILDGLPRVKPPEWSVSAIQQRAGLTRSGDRNASVSSTLQAVGTLWGNSWFFEIDQRDLTDSRSWGLEDAQIVRFTPTADFYLGTQQPIWPENNGDILGFTSILRFNYAASERSLGQSPNLERRLHPAKFQRTLSGRATPGTLVQLRRKNSRRVLEEVLVDDSGLYRFRDLPIGTRGGFSSYQLYLFEEGKLDNTPVIRNVKLSGALTGQLPQGGTALSFSLGRQRDFAEFSQTTPFGHLQDWVGGVSGLWGVTDTLTLGIGAAYDSGLLGFGELLWQPQSLPVNASLALSTGNAETPLFFEGQIQAQPTRHLRLSFLADELSRRLDLDWSIRPGLSLNASVDSKLPARLNLSYSTRFQDVSSSTGISIDSDQELRFRQAFYWKQLEFSGSISNTGDAYGELGFEFSKHTDGHAITASFDQSDGHRLGALQWRYRSPKRSYDGVALWQASLGYGIGDSGAGVLASVETVVLPGLAIRASYQQVSRSSSEDRFSLNLVSSFESQQGIRPGSNRSFGLRTQGGLFIEPFLDANQNGKLDAGEERYTDANLVVLNNKPLQSARVNTSGNVYRFQLAPGVYRVDLDPSGLPIDWQALEKSYAVEVVAGSYTPLRVPLVPSYSVTGTITQANGKPLRGARIEAIDETSGHRVTSVTDRAGVYYLDGLRRATYQIKVNGQPSTPHSLTLDKNSESYFEFDLVLVEAKQTVAVPLAFA